MVTARLRNDAAVRRARAAAGLAAAVVAAVLLVAVAPLPVLLGAGRLTVLAVLATGASLTVGRAGSVDLAAGAVAGTGAYLGGVAAALLDVPAALGLVGGGVGGAVAGALITAIAGRVGRTLSALTSLAAGAAVVALLAGWEAAGGAAGFHAVPLLTPGDRTDLTAVLALLLLAALLARRTGSGLVGARASVAIHGPGVARSLGRTPTVDAAVVGAVAGAVLGIGGAAGAALAGSVAPAGYGLSLSAGLALAVLVGGAPPLGPVLGVLLLWGPSVVWPLAPVIGDAPPLLVMGPVALAVLALRRRPWRSWPTPAPPPAAAADAPAPRCAPTHELRVHGFPLPHGGDLDLEVPAGTAAAVVGPNGSGKSTLLAAIGGQVADRGTVTWGSGPLPSGAAARARAGVARTWQRAPSVPLRDALAVATTDRPGVAEAAAVRDLLGPDADRPAGLQLRLVAARRPSLALLDEPGAELPAAAVAAVVRWLTAGGTTVVLAEHRPELVAVADRVVQLSREVGDGA